MMAPRGNAVGIDLGTAYSCVGVWRGSDHSVEIIPNEHGNRTTPSVIAFTALERLVGQAALNQIACNPTNTVFDAKRLIGRHFSDNSVQSDKQLWPFQVVAGPHDKPLLRVHFKGHEKCFSPEDISSMVLLKMKAIAEDFLGSDVRKAVVTVPAYFTNVQRRATKSACKAAGLDVLQIMNEPTAAAMAYGLNSRSSSGEHVVVFDLGGGTFDVSVLYIKNKKIIVRAVSGDTHLGGQDFNSRMVAFCIKEFQAKHRLDVSGEAKAVRRLQAACERAKRELSFTVETVIEVPCLHGADDFRATVRRAKFEQLNMDLFDKCLRILNETLTEAGLSKAHIHKVVLVGGSTRIPKIQEMIRDMFGATKLCKTIHPDEAVAFGAAIQAAVLNKDRGAVDIVLRDVTPLSLGISTKGDIMSVIIPRNTPIPVRRERRYVTANPNERSMAIKVVEGDSPDCRYNNYLGGFDLNDLPAAPRCRVSVIVRFDIDANGILNVVAEHKGLGLRKEMCFFSQRDRLDGEEVAEMIAEVERFKFEDRLWKETAELRNQLDMLIYDMKQKAISETLSGNLAAKDSQIIDDGLTAAQNWLSSNESASKAELSRKLKELRLLCADLLVNDPKHALLP